MGCYRVLCTAMLYFLKRRLPTTEYAIALILERLKFLQPVFRLSVVIGIISGGLALTSLRLPAASPGGY